MRDYPTPVRLTSRSLLLVGITFLALALGGSTEIWAQAVILLLASLLMALAPPKVYLGAVPTLVGLMLLLLGAMAFLPAGWGFMPEWQRHLSVDLHAPLGTLRTPQPWLTLQSFGLLLFGIVWACYLMSQEWTPVEKSQALRLLLAGLMVLALVSVIAFLTGYRIPGWNQQENRGWFPNRNQTADVLAMGGILGYAVASKSLQRKSWVAGLWLLGLLTLGAALVISYSRAGIILFFVGVALWQVGLLFRPKSGRHLALSGAALLLLLSLFFLFGGSTLERFFHASPSLNPYEDDYRIRIQEDALLVSAESPFLGVGLGNFEPVFTTMRHFSADQNRTLHPESDWLWLAVEMGWIAPVLLLVALRWWIGQCLPFAYKSGETLRRAAMVAAGIFLIHGFVDVAGHRLGSAMVGLLLLSMAMATTSRGTPSRWVPHVFRGAALILAVIGLWWMASVFSDDVPPTSATLARIRTNLDQAVEDGRLASVSEAANSAIEIAPLNWIYYFRRASAEAFRAGALDQARNDFRIARYLEPNWVDLCVNEGDVWLGAEEPEQVLEAWREALRRVGDAPYAIDVYSRMLRLSGNSPILHEGLKTVAVARIDYQIGFLNFASPEELKAYVQDLMIRDPNLQTLTAGQQVKLFEAWSAHGDQDEMNAALLEHPAWQTTGWKFLAQHQAAQEDFQMASLTAYRYLPPPVMPTLTADQSLNQLQTYFADHPHDIARGVMLAQMQTGLNRTEDALATLAVLSRQKDCPRYVYYLQGRLQMKMKQWQEAWSSLQQFGL